MSNAGTQYPCPPSKEFTLSAPASQPSTAQVEKLARNVVATYDDPHLSPVAVERAMGMLRKELEQPSPARSDKDAERVKSSGCRMTGGICACHSGGSFGGCVRERASCCAAVPAELDGMAERAKSGTLTPANCPFCGGSATYLVDRISCDCCLADMSRAKGQSDDDLLAAWSRRAERTPSGESIAWHADVKFRVFVSSVMCQIGTDDFEPAFRRLSNYIEARRATAGNAAPTEAVYQMWRKKSLSWIDVAKQGYDLADQAERRIVYLASNAATAAPRDLPMDATAELDRLLARWARAAADGVFSCEAIREQIVAHLASNAGAAPAMPEGFALMPIEPTPEMLAVIKEAAPRWYAASVYANLLEAAPSNPPVGAKEQTK